MTGQSDPFQLFASEIYARPGIAAACLELQDQHGLDVNLVLFAIWCGTTGHCLTRAEMAVSIGQADEWNGKLVHPLRALRRALKQEPDEQVQAVRQLVVQAEIAAERMLEAKLWQKLAGIAGAPDRRVAENNLGLYLDLSGLARDQTAGPFEELLKAAFGAAAGTRTPL